MGAIASQITSPTIVYLTVYSGADQTKHQSPASLAFVWGIHWWSVNSPHKWPVTRKMFPFHDLSNISKRRFNYICLQWKPKAQTKYLFLFARYTHLIIIIMQTYLKALAL